MRRYFVLLATVCLLITLVRPSPTRAASGTIESLEIAATLQTNGSVSVNEIMEMSGKGHLFWSIFSNVKDLVVTADGVKLNGNQFSTQKIAGGVELGAQLVASKWTVSYSTTNLLIRHNNRDQFFFKVFQQPGTTIHQTSIRFTLPEAIDQTDSEAFSGNVYAIGGVVGAVTDPVESQTITYHADFTDGRGIMTISASWPKTVLNLSRGQEIRLAISNLDSVPWIILGIALPLGALLVLIALAIRQRIQDRVRRRDVVTNPPTNISALITGVLVHKKIYPEEIVALLVDLCQRGYLVIINQTSRYYLGVRRLPDEHLQSWERNILEEILPTVGVKVSNEELLEVSKQTLFNPKVRDAFAEIYQIITAAQYFTENPHLTRVRYKLIGLAFYFVGLIGLVWTATSNATPYLLIPLAGTIVLSWLIMRLTRNLTSYTVNGLLQRDSWLSFGEYLGSNEQLPPDASRNHTFEKYLPYAIVLGKTTEWANRFDKASTIIISPDWFVNYDTLTATELADQIVKFTTKISKMLSSQRGPLVN